MQGEAAPPADRAAELREVAAAMGEFGRRLVLVPLLDGELKYMQPGGRDGTCRRVRRVPYGRNG